MPQNTSLEGLRSQIITSIFGRRFGLAGGNSSASEVQYLAGPAAFRNPVDGVSSAGSTITSTSVTSQIPPYGVTLIGATAASATTAYVLSAPVPGVRKILFDATTGQATVGTTVAGAFIATSGSITSTYGYMSFAGKGSNVELIGLTTALWGLLSASAISTGGVAVTFV